MILVLAFHVSVIQYAEAVSVVNVTFPAGTATLDVTYAGGTFSNNNDTTAYVIGTNGGVVYVWKKSGSGMTENTIIGNTTLSGSSSARAIEIDTQDNIIFAATNDKLWRLNSNPSVQLERADAIANSIRRLVFADNGQMYFCTNDVFGVLNQVTLAPTTLYTDAGANGILDCAFDTTNGFAYLSGDTIGGGGGKDLLKVSLSTFTVVDSTGATNFFFGVCYDSNENRIWVTESSATRVTKLDSDLNLIGNVTVGTTPRFCSITDDDQARRLYVSNEGTDNVSIVDIDANAVISTQTTCNQGVTTPRSGVKRLFNTTNLYQPCPDTTNSIIIDNTVSEEIPSGDFVGGIDCSLTENMQILICRLNSINQTPLGGASQLISDSTFDIFVQVGLIDGSNTDCKTNGVGYAITATAIGIMVGLMWVASRGNMDIPNYVWVVSLLAIIGMITAFDCLDPAFFIITIIVIVALGAVKARNLFGGTFE